MQAAHPLLLAASRSATHPAESHPSAFRRDTRWSRRAAIPTSRRSAPRDRCRSRRQATRCHARRLQPRFRIGDQRGRRARSAGFARDEQLIQLVILERAESDRRAGRADDADVRQHRMEAFRETVERAQARQVGRHADARALRASRRTTPGDAIDFGCAWRVSHPRTSSWNFSEANALPVCLAELLPELLPVWLRQARR